MEITRREFGKQSLIGTAGLAALVSGGSVALGGCNVISDIENWVPVGLAALDSIESELTANGIPIPAALKTIENDVKLALTDLQAAAQEYNSATPPPAGALAKLQLALKTVSDQFGNFLAAINIPGGPVLTLILNLAGIVLSTVAAFANKLPAAPAAAKVSITSGTYKVGAGPVSFTPKARSRRTFKKDWNGELDTAKKAGVVCPSSAYQKLSFFEHF